MPRQVDHDVRRSEVAEVTCNLIAREGVEATTVRRVAEEANCSTTIVSHYFANKHDLLLFCYRMSAANSQARINAVIERNAADLQGCLEALLPLDHARQRDWAVWLALWSMAVGTTEFHREHQSWFQAAVKLISAIAEAKWGIKTARSRAHYKIEARRLFALVSGLAAQAVFAPAGFTPRTMREMVAVEIDRIEQSRR